MLLVCLACDSIFAPGQVTGRGDGRRLKVELFPKASFAFVCVESCAILAYDARAFCYLGTESPGRRAYGLIYTTMFDPSGEVDQGAYG